VSASVIGGRRGQPRALLAIARGAGQAALLRAAPMWAALGIVAAVITGPTGMIATDVVAALELSRGICLALCGVDVLIALVRESMARGAVVMVATHDVEGRAALDCRVLRLASGRLATS
jgi:hypothetical protein